MNEPKIILASSSPRRHLLLQQMGLSFDVIPADIGEDVAPGSDPAETVEALSLQKAILVAEHLLPAEADITSGTAGNPGTLIIGADTIVVLDGEILGKPSSPQHAAEMLRALSGRTHQVYTGVALVFRNENAGKEFPPGQPPIRQHTFHERTDVTFGTLSEEEIAAYVSGGSPMDKAGAYGIQDDLGALFVERIQGDYYNVVGFPLFRFYREVNKLMPGIVTPFQPLSKPN